VTDIVFAIPGDIDLPTGGYVYDRRVLALLPSFGVTPKHLALPGSFPDPTPADLKTAARLLAKTAPAAPLLIDGLAYGALPADLILALDRRIMALVHHPLCLETGLSPERQAVLHASEKAALALAERVICTSPVTARTLMADFGVPEDKIVVAEPGTDPAPKASGTIMPMQLLAVGAVSTRKGFPILIRALEPLSALDWRLTIAGSLERDAAVVAELKHVLADSGLQDRVRLTGAVVPDTLAAFYDSADIFVMPSLYEGYGMVLAEAMARGLAILCTTGGAAAETVPDAAAIKVPPGDAQAFSAGLKTLLTDRKLRRRLEAASWNAGRKLPTWHETARRIFMATTGFAAETIIGVVPTVGRAETAAPHANGTTANAGTKPGLLKPVSKSPKGDTA
jgi:glycosyltransferase involved in cell wall biosynthesis